VQQLNVSDALLEGIQKNLHALKDFLDQNPQLFHSSPGDHAGARSAAASEQDAWRVRLFRRTRSWSLLTPFFHAVRAAISDAVASAPQPHD
jgi:nuclear pore complex protein Nup155